MKIVDKYMKKEHYKEVKNLCIEVAVQISSTWSWQT